MGTPRIQSVEFFRASSLNSSSAIRSQTPNRPLRCRVRGSRRQCVPSRARTTRQNYRGVLETSPELTAQLADRSPVGSVRSSVPPNDGIAVSAGEPTATANRVAGELQWPGAAPKGKTASPDPDGSRCQLGPHYRPGPAIHHANRVLGSAYGGRGRGFASKSKANHHGSLRLP